MKFEKKVKKLVLPIKELRRLSKINTCIECEFLNEKMMWGYSLCEMRNVYVSRTHHRCDLFVLAKHAVR